MEKYQLLNPNNARVYIDYRKEKDKVRFEYVGKNHPLKIIFFWFVKLFLVNPIVMVIYFLPLMTLIILLDNKTTILDSILKLILVVDWFVVIPILISLIIYSNKNLLNKMPRLQRIGGRFYELHLTPLDIKDTNIEIPLFKNIGLDYIATEEFSKYLERVEIIEHPFNYYVRSKKKPQEYLWKAIFYFSQIPKTGEINIKFS